MTIIKYIKQVFTHLSNFKNSNEKMSIRVHY